MTLPTQAKTTHKTSGVSSKNTDKETMTYLVVNFNDREEFDRAKEWFDTFSDYTYDRSNSEFRCLYFPEENLDALETAICDELTNEGFESFYFTSEDDY